MSQAATASHADPTVVNGTAEDITDEPAPTGQSAEPVPALALVRRDRTAEVLKPVDADELIGSFQSYQELLPRLLSSSDYQAAGKNRDGTPRQFVKKSGWRKIARAFRLNCEIVRLDVDRDGQGSPVRASAVVRATAPNGDFQEGDGHCSIEEDRFREKGGAKKVENDLPATAITRAKNRAISDLVGMGEVSAEEVTAYGASGDRQELPAWAAEAARDRQWQALAALTFLLDPAGSSGHDPDPAFEPIGGAEQLAKLILAETKEKLGGTIPEAAVGILIRAAGHTQKAFAAQERAATGAPE